MTVRVSSQQERAKRSHYWLLIGAAVLVATGAFIAVRVIHHSNSVNTYGSLPSWLQRTKVPSQRTLTASALHPRLGIEGQSFEVIASSGHVVVTLSGPVTPPFVTPPPPTTRATFDLTFTKVSGTVLLRSKDFGIIDGHGNIFYATSFVGGKTTVHAVEGRSLSLQISQVMATGTGSIAWAPDGRHPLVTWEYTLEND